MATDHELRGNWELKTDVVYAKYENYDVSSKGIKKKLSSLLFDKWKMWCLKYIWCFFLRISCTTTDIRIPQVSKSLQILTSAFQ